MLFVFVFDIVLENLHVKETGEINIHGFKYKCVNCNLKAMMRSSILIV